MSDNVDKVIKKEHKVNEGPSVDSSKMLNMCAQRLLYEAQSTDSNQSTQTSQEIIINDIIIEINNGQDACNSRKIVPARADNKAAERSRLYRERHKEKINQRRREVRHRKIKELQQIQALTNKQNSNEMEQNSQATSSNQSVSSNSHKQRQQRYYERHREELNKRKRDKRLKRRGPQPPPATAAERGRKYRERHGHEINERRRRDRRRHRRLQRQLAECGEDRSMSGTVQSPVERLLESNQADESKLISLVKQRPLLFARCNMPIASYKNQVKLLWEEVANEMGCGATEARRKWSRIRDAYWRHIRAAGSGAAGNAVLADDLDFLKEHIITDKAPNAKDVNRTEELVNLPHEDLINRNLNIEQSPAVDSSTSDVLDDSSWRSSACSWTDPQELERCWPQQPDTSSSHSDSAYFQFFRSIFQEYQQLVSGKRRLFRRQCLSYLHELLSSSADPPGPFHDPCT